MNGDCGSHTGFRRQMEYGEGTKNEKRAVASNPPFSEGKTRPVSMASGSARQRAFPLTLSRSDYWAMTLLA